MLLELFFQHPTRLNEDTSIDGLVRHLQALIVQIRPFEPAGDLLRRPVQRQLAGHYTPEPVIQRESTEFWTTGAVPGSLIRSVRTIPLPIDVSRDLTADGRRCTIERPGNLTQRRAGSEAPRYLLALGQRERPDGALAASPHRGDATARKSRLGICLPHGQCRSAMPHFANDAKFRLSEHRSCRVVPVVPYHIPPNLGLNHVVLH